MAAQAKILDFGLDAIGMAGSLPDRQRAMRDAGFSPVMPIARDLRKLAVPALPLGVEVADAAPPCGRHLNEFSAAREVVCHADMPKLGLVFDSFAALASRPAMEHLDTLDTSRVPLVPLVDFMCQRVRPADERIETARHFRVLPGAGVRNDQVAAREHRSPVWLAEDALSRSVPVPNGMRQRPAAA